jgi:RNA polymerase sigma factor (sigma-70 family)
MPLGDDKSLIPTRASLLSRLKNAHDDESWRDFFDTYWRLIYNAATKAGLSDAEAQDVVQETVLSAWRNLPGFKYDTSVGSFKGWLLQLTNWRITDCMRNRQEAIQAPDAEDGTEITSRPIERAADPRGFDLQAVWDQEFEMNLLEVAMERAKLRVDPKDYQIFDLYFIKEWPAARVAETLGVTRARVYLAKHRVGGMIKKSLKKLRKPPVKGKLASKQ